MEILHKASDLTDSVYKHSTPVDARLNKSVKYVATLWIYMLAPQ